MLSPFLLLSLLFVFATSSLAQVVTVYENFVCAVGEIAYLDAAGVGACGIPATVFLNPTFTRCPSFTYLQTTISVTTLPDPIAVVTESYECSTFAALCPQGFTYAVADATGLINVDVPLLCVQDPDVSVAVAQTSCERVGGAYLLIGGICLAPNCPATGCAASDNNCRLVDTLNVGSAPITCTATGSICLNFNSPNYPLYACGVSCNALACYDTTPSVQVCDAINNQCIICESGVRIDETTCSGAILGSQAPQRRRERLIRERKAKNARQFALCPAGLTACSVGLGREGGYECLDTEMELESCGGCRSTGLGTDCSALTGVKLGAVTCDQGRCIVSACRGGFKLRDGRCL